MHVVSIAETEKYAHVTYFLGVGKEKAYEHEIHILIPSIRARNYIEHPQMSANLITQTVLGLVARGETDFYIINYANADMVGHSGNLDATIKAVECIDEQIQKLYKAIVKDHGGTLYITADHGNAEQKWDYRAQQPHTAHTTNPVPFIAIQKGLDATVCLPLHALADIAPYIVHQLGLEIPPEMKRS